MIAERAASIANLGGRFRALSADETVEEIAHVADLLRNANGGSWVTRQRDVSDLSRADAFKWLAGLDLPDVRVRACWVSLNEGVEMQLLDFVRLYDDLWLPGADDVYISDPNGQFFLLFEHEERITVWSRSPVAAAASNSHNS